MMLDNLYEEITKLASKKRRFVTSSVTENILIPLLILKYLCDTKAYSYEEIVKLDSLENMEIKFEDNIIKFEESKTNKLLPLIQYEDLTSLIKEYLSTLKTGINIIPNNEKKVCISTMYTLNLYDTKGNTVYITTKYSSGARQITWFKFFDKVLKIKNEYITYDELDITKYDKLYIHDFMPKYRFIRNSNNDIYDLIRKTMPKNKNLSIILHTPYKKISNMNEAWYLLRYLNTVILYDDYDTFLEFNHKDDDNVSIINYQNIKNKSLSKLYEIIKTNRRQKDILTKTTIGDIRKNYYRIGFKLYQDKITPDVTNINDIVAENTRLVQELSDLDSQIEVEINKLINR